MPIDEQTVVDQTRRVAGDWLRARAEKFEQAGLSSMTPNPLLLPLVAALHGISSASDLTRLYVEGHLIVGHNTGFGKLIDEKLLPQVFGTEKLTGRFRGRTPPFSQAAFNDIDHLVPRGEGVDLLSLKASRWTINLGGATNLNSSFKALSDYYVVPDRARYREIVVGVLFGKAGALGDKYEVLRGATPYQRTKHGVTDLTETVRVVAGREFWSWLNDDEERTQDWVLAGILAAAREYTASEGALRPELMWAESRVIRELEDGPGGLDFEGLLRDISG